MATGLQLGSDGISHAIVAQWGSGDISQEIGQWWLQQKGSGGCSEVVEATVTRRWPQSRREMAALRQWWPHPDSGGHKKGNVGHIVEQWLPQW